MSALVLLTACGAAGGTESCADESAGIVSAGRLPETHDSARFRELWRVGGGDEYMSAPLPLAVSREGRAAIADFALGEVFVIEPDGTWHGRIARRGKGPGELTSPVAAVWGDDGTLHVYDIAKPAILHFAPDLTHTREERANSDAAAAIFAAGSLEWAGLQPSGAAVFLPGPSSTGAGTAVTEIALRADPIMETADTLRSVVVPVVRTDDFPDTGVPGYARISASVGAGGRLALIGDDSGWLVDVYEADGARSLRLCAEAPSQPLSDAERGRGASEEFRELAAAFASAPPPEKPARHGRIIVGADGTLWVQRERRPPYPDLQSLFGQPGTTFDVFSPDGRHLRTLKLPAGARLQGALRDTLWAYEASDLDEVFLVAYEIIAQ